jgi:hypothetical protein
MRGSCGRWEKVVAEQTAYAASPTALLQREAAQLDALAAGGLAVARAAGYGGGVLFTEPVTGPTLADLVFKTPQRTGEFLGRRLGTLDVLQRPVVAEQAGRPRSTSAASTRRSAASSTGSPAGPTSISSAPTAWRSGPGVVSRSSCGRSSRGFCGSVSLRRSAPPRSCTATSSPSTCSSPTAPTSCQCSSTGLQRGPAHADAAKFVSRTVLSLIAAPPPHGTTAILDGIDGFVQGQLLPMRRATGGLYLCKLLVTWLMDTANITTTYLSAPAGLPLPEHAGAVVERVEAVCTLLDRVSALLMADAGPAASWRLALTHAAKAARR